MSARAIYCATCECDVQARLTDGSEAYPHRRDLHNLPFWMCDACRRFVGCHHRHSDPCRRKDPLGVIPSHDLKRARSYIHRILDPIWKQGRMKRSEVYSHVAKALGVSEYHTAELRDIETARRVYGVVHQLRRDLGMWRQS